MKRILITVMCLWLVLDLNIYAKEAQPEYIEYIDGVCETYEVDPYIVQAIIFYESSWCTGAANGPYCGLMQVSLGHKTKMKELGVTDLFNGYQNILIGVSLLSDYIEANDGDVEKGIDAYAGYRLEPDFYEKGKHTKYSQKVFKLAESLRNENEPAAGTG